jgi:hypothetical protein
MTRITIRHYRADGGAKAPYAATGEAILKMGRGMAPRVAALGMELAFEEIRIEAASDADRHNLVTFDCPEAGRSESPLETLLGLDVRMEPCGEEPEKSCRSLVFEGTSYQAVPMGLIADGLFRTAFAVMGRDSSCEACGGGCGGSCGGR